MPSDLLKQAYDPSTERLHADAELGMSRIRSAIDGLDAAQIAYTPSNPSSWAGTPPTTVAAALDRLAAGGGTYPIPEL